MLVIFISTVSDLYHPNLNREPAFLRSVSFSGPNILWHRTISRNSLWRNICLSWLMFSGLSSAHGPELSVCFLGRWWGLLQPWLYVLWLTAQEPMWHIHFATSQMIVNSGMERGASARSVHGTSCGTHCTVLLLKHLTLMGEWPRVQMGTGKAALWDTALQWFPS